MKSYATVALSACLLSSSCASIPPMRVAYYPAQARSYLTVTQVLTCSAKGDQFTVVTTPTLTTQYKTQIDKRFVRHFNFDSIDSHLADTTVLLKTSDDIRLLGLNTTQEGQAQAVVKSGLDVGTSASTAAGAKPGTASQFNEYLRIPDAEQKTDEVCGDKGIAANGKDLTVKYGYEVSDDDYVDKVDEDMTPDDPGEIGRKVKASVRIHKPSLKITVSSPEPILSLANTARSEVLCPATVDETHPEDGHTLCLRPVQVVTFEIRTNKHLIWEQSVPVPHGDLTMAVPVEKSPWFGKMTTTVAIGDSGAIEQIGYSKTTGATAALATLAAVITFGATR